jgi:hypothetical protein
VTGKELCISEMVTGKEIGSQKWDRKKKWLSKMGPEMFLL